MVVQVSYPLCFERFVQVGEHIMIDKLKSITSNDTVGFTDCPRADIKTHRSLATTTKWMSILVVLVGVWNVQAVGHQTGGVLIAIAAFIYVNAIGLELQALRWEMEMEGVDE